MALIPFIDLFNHTSPTPKPLSTSTPTTTPCDVHSSPTSFEVTTATTHQPSSELLLSYGPHTNDTLWSEYGFLLPSDTNTCDSTPLDSFILAFPPVINCLANLTALEKHGYLGTYTLHHDGSFCYRTEMAAWSNALGRAEWSKIVAEGRDPADEGAMPHLQGRFIGLLEAWMMTLRDAAEGQIGLLEEMGVVEAEEVFETMPILKGRWSVQTEREVVQKRKGMALDRWRQISVMAQKALEDLSELTREVVEKELAERCKESRK